MWFGMYEDIEDVSAIYKTLKKDRLSCDYFINAPSISKAKSVFKKVSGGCVPEIKLGNILKYANEFYSWKIGDPLVFVGKPKKDLVVIESYKHIEFEIKDPAVTVYVYFDNISAKVKKVRGK